MREIRYISPTSYSLWKKNREDWYRQYASPISIPRDPQADYMAAGSAFDAYVKSALHQTLYPDSNDQKFDFQTLFDKQVEPHNREWAMVHGKYLFEEYKRLGAFDDLLASMQHEHAKARFEVDLEGVVGSVNLLGKPDAWYHNPSGNAIILDWKVNGYCSKSNKSPEPGYYHLRGDKQGKTQHKDCMPVSLNGTMINGMMSMDQVKEDWASQLSIYAWLCGAPVGSEFICAIDQMACSYSGTDFPNIRVAEHRCIVSKQYQMETYKGLMDMWSAIKSGHIFTDMPLEQSKQVQRELDAMNVGVNKIMTDGDDVAKDLLGLNKAKIRW